MNRFFVSKQNILEEQLQIIMDNADDVKHIDKVLRLEIGDCIEVCDGQNREYEAEITAITKKSVSLRILEKREAQTEPPVEIVLYQGIPKATKMDVIIQKCTELGISNIVPMITERTIVQLKDRSAEEKKLERWQRIAEEAAKQCKRGVIPKIAAPKTFAEVVEEVGTFDLAVIPYEKEEAMGLKIVLNTKQGVKKIGILIGPEGGFAQEEIHLAQRAGILPVTLGPRILRTETAGFTALSILMYELGDLGGM